MLAPLASAQYATRTEQIQARRQQKLEGLSPEQAPDGEQTMNTIEDKKILERLAFGYHGLTLVMGGLGTGQGFAFGPQYLRTDLAGGEVTVRGSARYALSKAYLADAVLSFPRLADEHFFLEFAGTHRNYPTVDYYGPGSDSREQDRTHFRLEDTSIGVTAGVRPFGALEFGIRAGALLVNIGRETTSTIWTGRVPKIFSTLQTSSAWTFRPISWRVLSLPASTIVTTRSAHAAADTISLA